MRKRKYIIGIAATLIISGVLVSVLIGQNLRLRVATDPSLPPFEYVGGVDGREVLGFDVRIAERIAKNAHMQLEIIELPFYGMFSALESGRVDMAIAAIPTTIQRAAEIDFSISYYVATQVLVTLVGQFRPQQIDDLQGGTVAARASSIGELVGGDLSAAHNFSILIFNTNDELFDALRDGLVSAVMIDEELARYYLDAHPDQLLITDIGLEQMRYAVAIPSGDDRLLQVINRTIRALRSSGEYTRLLEEYIVPYSVFQ